jgi:NTE family protein
MANVTTRTAFVLAGGGSFGAIQVGMLQELVCYGVKPDFVVGSSVGALNGAYFAGDPTAAGVARLESIWRELKRRDLRSALTGHELT